MADDARRDFVPDDFAVPRELIAGEFRLEPLGPQHNASDYEAWTSSSARSARTQDCTPAVPGASEG